MVNPLTNRNISSVRDQQASPRLPSISNSPVLKSKTNGDPSPRISSHLGTPSDRSAPASSSEDRHSSPFAASISTRSSEYSFDRNSVSSFGQRSISTAATFATPHDADRLPPIASLDTAKSGHFSPHPAWSDRRTLPPPITAMNPIDKAEVGPRRVSPPPALRRPASPAGKISHHSAEWDLHSDRGSPHLAGRRPILPPTVPSSASAAGPGAAHSAYAREYVSPRGSYRESAYREPHPAQRELSPSMAASMKRRLSNTSDLGARRAMPEGVDRNGGAWATADYPPSRGGYPDAGYYRGRDRAESPERTYASSYSRDAAYPPRYADPRMDDPRYSPRHAHPPASPSTSRTAYHRGYDAATPSSHPYHMSRRSDRYSPGPSPRSPSYAPRQALPPPQAPSPYDAHPRSGEPHSSYARRPSPPPFASDPRPQLPPLSSRTPVSRYPGAAPSASRSGRYTPPLEAAHADRLSPTPEPHAYSEPFYPDRRLYFARERIQDPEMDDYYHGQLGSSGGGKARYADYYDPYGSPHTGSYPPPGVKAGNGLHPSPGMPHMPPRHHDARLPYANHYGPGDYMGPDPRDPYAVRQAGMVGRPGMPIPQTGHVPPGPSTGIAPPPRRRGKLPKPVTDLLKSWLLEHASHPYPTEDEKRSLCGMTGLTLSQVSNWFINARRRILLPSGANGSPGGGGATAAQVKAAFRDDSQSPEP